MAFHIFIHHSDNTVGYVVKSDNTTVTNGCINGNFKGYSEPMIMSLIKCFSAIPEGSEVEIYSPNIQPLIADCGTIRCTDIRRFARNMMKKYLVTYHKASRHDKRILEAKKLAGCKHKNAEHIESALVSEQINLIPDYIAYTDGSCNNLSPYGEGGAAYIILDGQRNLVKQNSKGFVGVTNNRMELMAILSAVAAVPEDSTLVVYTDSQYCIQVLTNKANANNFSRPNANIIRQYFNYASRLKAVRFEWVKGHDGNEFNEMVDALAQSRTEEMRTIHNIPVYDYRNSPKCRK
jgi:ribonuclease HI